jgi:methionyl-tRNA synthetase
MSRFYVTTPIYYVNDVPHLGTAYTTLVTDALRRYGLVRGRNTRMLTGTDEHGLKLEREARERGLPPEEFVTQMSDRFEATWPKLEVEPDDFIRTTQDRHQRGAQALWARIKERNPDDIYLGDYEGWYCVGCEELKTEKELEQPGNICPLHKRPVERVKEQSYFFRLSRYQGPLLEAYEAHPELVRPETRRNEVVSFVQSGLRDLSISRTSFEWGIPVPGDPKHVMYVWFDALSNYWTALQDTADHQEFWGHGSTILHLVGKDILRFHAVYWPAFLMSAGLRLPTTVFAHGFLTYGGQKMSKSLRNAVDPLRMAREFGAVMGGADPTAQGRAGAEVLRYQLLRAISFGQDGDFDLSAMVERYNADLGKNLGNLLSRTLGLCTKMTAGKVPAVAPGFGDGPFEAELVAGARQDIEAARLCWDRIEPHLALERTLALCTRANVYVDKAAPWAAAKGGDTARVDAILARLLQTLDWISVLIWPVLPTKSDEMRAQLGLARLRPSTDHDQWPNGPDRGGGVEGWPPWTRAGDALAPGAPLFPTLDPDVGRGLVERLTPHLGGVVSGSPGTANVPPSAAPAPKTPAAPAFRSESETIALVDYDRFSEIDLRVGLVVGAERVPKKDKLLKLAVDLGEPLPRAIVAGLALSFEPQDLVGRRVIVVSNLAPRDFGKGLVSQGMLLATGPSDKLVLATVPTDAPPGARLK